MKCLRKAVNKTRRDKIRNEVIRDMAGAKPVLQHIKQQQVKWFGHITRMPINQPALRAYNTKYSGWRARGRPRKRWSDSVADTLRTQGMSLLQATRLAADRQLCPPATPIGTSGRKKVSKDAHEEMHTKTSPSTPPPPPQKKKGWGTGRRGWLEGRGGGGGPPYIRARICGNTNTQRTSQRFGPKTKQKQQKSTQTNPNNSAKKLFGIQRSLKKQITT